VSVPAGYLHGIGAQVVSLHCSEPVSWVSMFEIRGWLLGDVASAAGGQEEGEATSGGAVQRPEMAAHVVPRKYLYSVSMLSASVSRSPLPQRY